MYKTNIIPNSPIEAAEEIQELVETLVILREMKHENSRFPTPTPSVEEMTARLNMGDHIQKEITRAIGRGRFIFAWIDRNNALEGAEHLYKTIKKEFDNLSKNPY